MGMDMKRYADRAADQAIPEALDRAYLQPGTIGAAGGVAAVIADEVLGPPDAGYLAEAYMLLAWHTALILHLEGVESTAHVTNLKFTGDRDAALELLIARAASVYRSGEDALAARAAGLWVALEDHAEVITGRTLDVILAS